MPKLSTLSASFDELVWRVFPLFIALIVSLPSSLRAQHVPTGAGSEADFLKATVVTAEDDSLDGYIQRWTPNTRTPEVIHFRRAPTAPIQTYQASDLKGFRLNDASRRFVSRSVQVDQVPTDPRAATQFLQSGQARQKPDTLFLEVIVAGPLSLYAKLGSRNHYYVASKSDISELLKRQQYVESQNAVATRRRYREQLASYTHDCPEVRTDTRNVSFRLQQMKALIDRYNQCVGDGSKYLRKGKPSSEMSFGIIGGYTQSQLSMSAPSTPGFSSFGLGPGYMLGTSLTIQNLRAGQHWAFHAQLLGFTQRLRSKVENGRKPFLDTALSASDHIDMTWLKSAAFARYYITDSGWIPYVESGVTLGYLLDFDAQTSIEVFQRLVRADSARTVSLDTHVNEIVGSSRRITPGVTVGTGIQYENFRIGMQAELTSGWASYSDFKTGLVNLYLTAEYRLF